MGSKPLGRGTGSITHIPILLQQCLQISIMCFIRFVMSDKHQWWHYDDKLYMVSNSYKRWVRHLVAETDAHIIHCGWDSQFCRGLYFHTYATGGVFQNDCFGLTCPDTVQDRCKSAHHWGPPCEHVDLQEGWNNDDRVVLNGGLVSTMNYVRSIYCVTESNFS